MRWPAVRACCDAATSVSERGDGIPITGDASLLRRNDSLRMQLQRGRLSMIGTLPCVRLLAGEGVKSKRCGEGLK